jgi:ABC-type Fe3+-hydroxamate transport system substrate-binding protein
LLYDLGLTDEVIGQTLFCIHPTVQHKTKPRIGGTKKLNLDKIRDLNPDLIIGNKEENDQVQIEQLSKEFPVWMSDVQNLADALAMINQIGELINKQTFAEEMVQQIQFGFDAINPKNKGQTCLYFIWKNPWMAAGKGTFIQDMLQRVGMENLALELDGRYPEVLLSWVKDKQPKYIWLSSEPFPFGSKQMAELKEISPNTNIKLVDGEMFSWYGSRLLKSVNYFKELTN